IVPVSDSIAWPQDEQNLAFSGTLVPQAKQNMTGSKFTATFASRNAANDSGKALHVHGRAVSKNFGNALHHFRGVVAHANHGIGAMLAGVLQKKLEGILARSLAQIRKKSDIAAPNRLQRSPKISDQAARAHHDSANDPEIPHNPIPRQIQPASNHSRIDSWHLDRKSTRLDSSHQIISYAVFCLKKKNTNKH